MKNQMSYSPEVRERAVRLVFKQQKEHDSQWSAIKSIASKIDCTAETLRTWVRRTETDQGIRVACRVITNTKGASEIRIDCSIASDET